MPKAAKSSGMASFIMARLSPSSGSYIVRITLAYRARIPGKITSRRILRRASRRNNGIEIMWLVLLSIVAQKCLLQASTVYRHICDLLIRSHAQQL